MLFSDRTGKSGSKWLDRLRSSKGIPTGDDIDLDSFLLSSANTHPQIVHQHRPRQPTRTPSPETRDPSMSTILAELFNMGTTLTQTYKKCPRKQSHPKFLAPSSSSAANNDRGCIVRDSPATDAVAVEEEEAQAPVDRGDEDDDDDDNVHDMKGFSRSEVTVIDTSCPGWKVDKFVFRKNSVWRVRERKPKFKSFSKEKKKKSNGTLVALGVDVNGIGTYEHNVVNMRAEKTVMMLQGI